MAEVGVLTSLNMNDSSTQSGSMTGVSASELRWDGPIGIQAVYVGSFTTDGSDFFGTVTGFLFYEFGQLTAGLVNTSFDYQANKTAILNADTQALYQAALGGDDHIWAGNNDDQLVGHEGDDEINGLDGNDLIEGGDGADNLFGWYGADIVKGENGNDNLLDEWVGSRDPTAFQVFRLYQATLDRAPDVAGHDFWTAHISNGMTVNQAATGFVDSPEFQSKYGATDNGQFVTLLYDNVLDRAPDSDGLAFWVGHLDNGTSRSDVVVGFSDSTEFQGQTRSQFLPYSTIARAGDFSADVYRLYEATLDREPDPGGLVHWTANLAFGASKLSVVSGFVGSAEFQAKYGATNNTEFVTLLYGNVLDRAPDSDGLAFWVNHLNQGMSRESVVLGFSDSAEFTLKTAPEVKAFMRSAASEDLNDVLNGGADDDSLVGGVGADTFQFVAGEVGNDLVGDLEPWDQVSFEGFGYASASDVTDHMTQLAECVEFSDQGQTIRFWGSQLSDFEDDMFIFV